MLLTPISVEIADWLQVVTRIFVPWREERMLSHVEFVELLVVLDRRYDLVHYGLNAQGDGVNGVKPCQLGHLLHRFVY